jgi:protein-S-isoprenylcysteine O-methyltransferase Ste14
MDIPTCLYALIVIHSGYLIQLSFRQPNSKVISTQTGSWVGWVMASPSGMIIARTTTMALALHQAVVALSLSHTLPRSDEVLQSVCPTPLYLDPQLFAWTTALVGSLALLYIGSYIRFQAYAQLGSNFTYRIAKPDQLITSGQYAYVRHPSYTGLFMVLLATNFLFFRQRGLVSCWLPLFDVKMVTNPKYAYLVPALAMGIPFTLFLKRVVDEEAMMENEFGQQWRDYRAGTKKFIPYVY